MLSEEMIQELVDGLCSIFSGNVHQIILYGSVARREETKESDIEKDKMDKWGKVLPFYKKIQEEGVVLWTAA